MKTAIKKILTSLVISVPIIILCKSTMAAPLPSVVVSIKPIHSLVAGVMEGVSVPELLLSGGGSPHDYSLKPSQAKQLSNADMVIWVGQGLESFLVKPLKNLSSNAVKLELAKSLNNALLSVRRGHQWAQGSSGHHSHHHHEENGEKDLHLWLDPRLAQQIVTQVEAALTELDPAHAGEYQANAIRLRKRLSDLHLRIQEKVSSVRDIPYMVFHDAYHYFETTYQLYAVGAITINPERRPGARQIRKMRNLISEQKARCVFSEPQFEPKLVATVIEGTGARTGVLDPLGSGLPPGPENYFDLMQALTDNLVTGLRQK